jgi:hypothetical protein
MMGTDALERAVEFVFDREGNCFGRGWLVVVCVCVCAVMVTGGRLLALLRGVVEGVVGVRVAGLKMEAGEFPVYAVYGERSVLMNGRLCWFLKERNARIWEVN